MPSRAQGVVLTTGGPRLADFACFGIKIWRSEHCTVPVWSRTKQMWTSKVTDSREARLRGSVVCQLAVKNVLCAAKR
jgi:hypothetical protein